MPKGQFTGFRQLKVLRPQQPVYGFHRNTGQFDGTELVHVYFSAIQFVLPDKDLERVGAERNIGKGKCSVRKRTCDGDPGCSSNK